MVLQSESESVYYLFMSETTGAEQVQTETVHKFERAGLGKAPFRLVGMTREIYQAVPGDPNCPIQPGTSCDYCGQGIIDTYWIRSSDGRRFKVGCDCVAKTGDNGLKRQIAPHLKAKRDAASAAQIAALEESLADPELREALEQRPHPYAGPHGGTFNSLTMLDWVNWTLDHAGVSGKVKAARAVRRLLGTKR
jgi:hypothetical protein